MEGLILSDGIANKVFSVPQILMPLCGLGPDDARMWKCLDGLEGVCGSRRHGVSTVGSEGFAT